MNKLYIGCKIIKAEPAKGYNNKLVDGRNTYPGDALFEEGYKVEYPDGYISWSPKAVFESAYRLITRQEIEMFRNEDSEQSENKGDSNE